MQGVVDDVLCQLEVQVEHVIAAGPAGGDAVESGRPRRVCADQIAAGPAPGFLRRTEGGVRRSTRYRVNVTRPFQKPMIVSPRDLALRPRRWIDDPEPVRSRSLIDRAAPSRALQRGWPRAARVTHVGRRRPANQVKLTNWSGYSGPCALRCAITACKSSIFLPVTRTFSSMIWAWTLILSCLMSLTIFRASSVSMPRVQGQGLAHGVVRGVLDLAAPQCADRHAAARHLFLHDLEDRLELPLVIGQDRQGVILLVELDRRTRPLEVKADGDLVLGLDDGVVHLGVVDLADDVEGMIVGHRWKTPE